MYLSENKNSCCWNQQDKTVLPSLCDGQWAGKLALPGSSPQALPYSLGEITEVCVRSRLAPHVPPVGSSTISHMDSSLDSTLYWLPSLLCLISSLFYRCSFHLPNQVSALESLFASGEPKLRQSDF